LVAQQSGLVRESENLGEMERGARAFLAADHREMILMAVEIGHQYDSGLVEAGGGTKNVPRQRDRRREYLVKILRVLAREACERGGRSGGDGVENAEQGVGIADIV